MECQAWMWLITKWKGDTIIFQWHVSHKGGEYVIYNCLSFSASQVLYNLANVQSLKHTLTPGEERGSYFAPTCWLWWPFRWLFVWNVVSGEIQLPGDRQQPSAVTNFIFIPCSNCTIVSEMKNHYVLQAESIFATGSSMFSRSVFLCIMYSFASDTAGKLL